MCAIYQETNNLHAVQSRRFHICLPLSAELEHLQLIMVKLTTSCNVSCQGKMLVFHLGALLVKRLCKCSFRMMSLDHVSSGIGIVYNVCVFIVAGVCMSHAIVQHLPMATSPVLCLFAWSRDLAVRLLFVCSSARLKGLLASSAWTRWQINIVCAKVNICL